MNRKIAIIRPDGNPIKKGFYNSQEIGLAKGLSKLKYDVDIFMSGTKNVKQTEIIPSTGSGDIIVYELPFFLIPEISHAIYPDLIKNLKMKSYDLIQVNEENELTCFLVARYAKKNNIPCIVYQGMYKPLSGRIRAAFQKLYDIFLLPQFRNNISHAFAKTTRAKQHLQKKGFKKISIVPVGLDTDAFQNADQRDWLTEYSIPKDSKIILYIGIFENRRNIDFIIDIAKNLVDKNYHFILVGDGPIFTKINQRIMDESIQNVSIPGQIPQNYIKSLYEIGDFFLLPSTYEIYGMVILESLYCGCPVISTNTAGAEDLIIDGTNGFIIDELDIQLWSNCIVDNINTISKNSLIDHVENNFTWDIIAQKYLKKAFSYKFK